MSGTMYKHGPGSLLEYMMRHMFVQEVLAQRCGDHTRLSELVPHWDKFERGTASNGEDEAILQRKHLEYRSLIQQSKGMAMANINLRRLPKWPRGALREEDLVEGIGFKRGQVEMVHGLVWMGVGEGNIHRDAMDNTLVQVSGENHLVLVPANCSWNIPESGSLHAGAVKHIFGAQGWRLPYFSITLRAGDAVVIPSNSVHVVTSKDPRRIGLNFFYEPSFMEFRWSSAPANYYKMLDPEHLAMRTLWLRTIKELWRTGAAGTKGFVMHGQRQELV